MTWECFIKMMEDAGVKKDTKIDWLDVDFWSSPKPKYDIRLPAFNEGTGEQENLTVIIK